MTELRHNVPTGKTRVVYVDLFSHEDGIVKDCDTCEEAFRIADEGNKIRSSPMDTVYRVYDDRGNLIRGEGAVDGPDARA